MSKLAFVLLVAAFAATVQGFPTSDNDIANAVAAGNWDEVHRILNNRFKQRTNWGPLNADVRSLKPEKGGHVYGEAEYTFHTLSNVNGKTNEQSGGHRVINDDGRIVEYDLKPNH